MPTLIPINLEVEPEALGPVLLLLNGVPGVHGIAPNLDGAGKKSSRKAQNGEHHPRPRSGINVNAIIIRELMTGQKNLQHLKDKVEQAGASSASVSSALYALSKKGVTTIVSAGVHALTPEALQKINEEHSEEMRPQLPAPPKRGESRPFVLEKVGQGLSRLEIVKAAMEAGMTERSIDGALTRLKAEKKIHATGPGAFKLGPPPSKSKKK